MVKIVRNACHLVADNGFIILFYADNLRLLLVRLHHQIGY